MWSSSYPPHHLPTSQTGLLIVPAQVQWGAGKKTRAWIELAPSSISVTCAQLVSAQRHQQDCCRSWGPLSSQGSLTCRNVFRSGCQQPTSRAPGREVSWVEHTCTREPVTHSFGTLWEPGSAQGFSCRASSQPIASQTACQALGLAYAVCPRNAQVYTHNSAKWSGPLEALFTWIGRAGNQPTVPQGWPACPPLGVWEVSWPLTLGGTRCCGLAGLWGLSLIGGRSSLSTASPTPTSVTGMLFWGSAQHQLQTPSLGLLAWRAQDRAA